MKEKFYPDATLDESFWGALCGSALQAGDLTLIYDPMLGKDHVPAAKHVLAYVAIGRRSAGEMAELGDEALAASALRRVDEMFGGRGSANLIGAPVRARAAVKRPSRFPP